MNSKPDEIADHIASQMTVDPLVLYEDRAEMEQHETKIDVSQWSGRNLFGEAGPIYVPGIAVTVSIPFSGDRHLWNLRA